MPRYAAARLVCCRRCRLVFAGDVPSADELREHYASYPASGELSALTAQRYRELLDEFEPFRQTGRLLDIGCGDGHFLAAARERGWTVYGSEYGEAPRARARARGFDVRPAPFDPEADEVGGFDVVTAFEVLEHVVTPQDEARRIGDLLRSGGCAYLTTPNFGSLTRRLAGPTWRVIEYPEHLQLFTPETLDQVLARAGLVRMWMKTTGISPSDIWVGVDPRRRQAAAPPPAPRFDQQIRSGVAASPMLDRGVMMANSALSRLGVGDTIKALYRR